LAETVLVILTGDEVAAQGAAVEAEGSSFRGVMVRKTSGSASGQRRLAWITIGYLEMLPRNKN